MKDSTIKIKASKLVEKLLCQEAGARSITISDVKPHNNSGFICNVKYNSTKYGPARFTVVACMSSPDSIGVDIFPEPNPAKPKADLRSKKFKPFDEEEYLEIFYECEDQVQQLGREDLDYGYRSDNMVESDPMEDGGWSFVFYDGETEE